MNPPIRHTIEVRCSQAHAFSVFTERVDAWWPTGHRFVERSHLRMEGRVGGRFFERSADGRERELGKIERWEPPHRVVYTWQPGAITGPTTVDVRFTDRGDHTLVEVTHAEGRAAMGEAWPARAQKFDAAWRHLLPDFAAYAQQPPPKGAEP